MHIREAEMTDREQIRALVEQSFQFSYALSPQQIETIVEGVFAAEPLGDRIDDPAALLLVAEQDVEGETKVVGVADAAESTLRWLHVDPDARDQGVGTALFERVRETVADNDEELTVRVLQQASEGGEFFTQFGLTHVGSGELEFDGEEFEEDIYAESDAEGTDAPPEPSEPADAGGAEEPGEPVIDVPSQLDVDGEQLVVDREEEIPGTDAPFYQMSQEAGGERYGYLCSNCGSTDVSADGLDRLECADCGNKHLADEWDDAYL